MYIDLSSEECYPINSIHNQIAIQSITGVIVFHRVDIAGTTGARADALLKVALPHVGQHRPCGAGMYFSHCKGKSHV